MNEKCKHKDCNIPYLHKKYYSIDRQDYIIPDITIEKIVDGHLFLIIVIECKDYNGSISVSEVEEFHSKLQQIGADNTKGIIVTRNGRFQKSACKYAKSKGISLAVYDNSISLISKGIACMESSKLPTILINIFPLYIIEEMSALLYLIYRKKYLVKYDFDKIIDYYLKYSIKKLNEEKK